MALFCDRPTLPVDIAVNNKPVASASGASFRGQYCLRPDQTLRPRTVAACRHQRLTVILGLPFSVYRRPILPGRGHSGGARRAAVFADDDLGRRRSLIGMVDRVRTGPGAHRRWSARAGPLALPLASSPSAISAPPPFPVMVLFTPASAFTVAQRHEDRRWSHAADSALLMACATGSRRSLILAFAA